MTETKQGFDFMLRNLIVSRREKWLLDDISVVIPTLGWSILESCLYRPARIIIVAETLGWQTDALWLGDLAFQGEVLAVYVGTGARAIVAEYVPAYADVPGWYQVGNSSFYIYPSNSDP